MFWISKVIGAIEWYWEPAGVKVIVLVLECASKAVGWTVTEEVAVDINVACTEPSTAPTFLTPRLVINSLLKASRQLQLK